ncbi:MAG: hypothetical protein IJI22_03080 [Bacilli bacterium]|nr:hypothetical protein [Bacilli bacterium]
MEEIYKLSLKGKEYWEKVFDTNTRKAVFKRVDKPCHIYVTSRAYFVNDNMICNFKDASGTKYLWCPWPLGTRLRVHRDFVVIEPSGIMVPKKDFTLVKDKKEIEEERGIGISGLTRTTYFCNLMSDLTRGGKDELSYDDVKQFRHNLLSQSTSDINNPSFLTPFEFAYMFTNVCNKKGIREFNRDELLSTIIEKAHKPEYLSLIWNINYSVGEHDNESADLFNAFELLRYIGLTCPDYDAEYKYGNTYIDSIINTYPNLVSGKESYYPTMEQFVNECFGISNKKRRGRTKTKKYPK